MKTLHNKIVIGFGFSNNNQTYLSLKIDSILSIWEMFISPIIIRICFKNSIKQEFPKTVLVW